jgi:hypothetical protein
VVVVVVVSAAQPTKKIAVKASMMNGNIFVVVMPLIRGFGGMWPLQFLIFLGEGEARRQPTPVFVSGAI